MKPPTPKQVKDVTEYWTSPPPESSARLNFWQEKIKGGWQPNRRIKQFGHHEAAQFYGVYIWEYINVLLPILRKHTDYDPPRV